MYAIGHLGIGYLATRALYRESGLNVAIILTFSLIPDIDLLIPFLQHRGPTHGVVVFLIFFAVLFAYRRKYIPYTVPYATHILSDIFTGSCPGGTQLLWPFSMEWFTFYPRLIMGTMLEAFVEVILLLVAISVLVYTKDYYSLLEPSYLNFSLFIPSGAIFVSLVGGIYYDFFSDVMVYPHLLIFIAFVLILAKNLLGINSILNK